jgi:hypothetical protein
VRDPKDTHAAKVMRSGLAWRECPINATKQTGSIAPDRQKQPQEAKLQRKKRPRLRNSG